MNSGMIAGALIAGSIALVWTLFSLWIIRLRVLEHNDNELRVFVQGKARMTINYFLIFFKIITFVVVGMTIGYFCS